MSKILYSPLFPQPDVICLQETHITKKNERTVLQNFQYDLVFANKSSKSGGLIVVFRRTLDYCVHDHITLSSPSGQDQCLMVHCTIDEVEMVIINVYLHPHRDSSNGLLMRIEENMAVFGCPNIICCGDFNTIMDRFKETTSRELVDRNDSSHSHSLNEFIESTELVDSFRIFNPSARRVTHFITGSGRRLDYIFVSGFFLNLIEDANVLPKMFSDHNPVFVNFSTDRNPKGPGYWRFPTPLLKNTEFITALKLKIKEIVNLRCADSNPALLWETVKLSIREEVSKFLKMDGL